MTDRPHVRVDPHVMGGSPVIDGTRIPTSVIAGIVAEGATPETVMGWYPQLRRAEVLLACWYEARYNRSATPAWRAARKAWDRWSRRWKPDAPQCPDPPEVTGR